MMLNGVELPVQDLSWIDLFDSVLYQGLSMVFLWCNIFRDSFTSKCTEL